MRSRNLIQGSNQNWISDAQLIGNHGVNPLPAYSRLLTMHLTAFPPFLLSIILLFDEASQIAEPEVSETASWALAHIVHSKWKSIPLHFFSNWFPIGYFKLFQNQLTVVFCIVPSLIHRSTNNQGFFFLYSHHILVCITVIIFISIDMCLLYYTICCQSAGTIPNSFI